MEKLKILAVDDNAVNLATIEQTLQDIYEIIPMVNGRRAVKYLSRQNADMVLLDVQMPDMDGIQTLMQIRSLDNGKDIPVIFLTAMKDEHTAAEGGKLGIKDYITKPFDADDLKTRINNVFES